MARRPAKMAIPGFTAPATMEWSAPRRHAALRRPGTYARFRECARRGQHPSCGHRLPSHHRSTGFARLHTYGNDPSDSRAQEVGFAHDSALEEAGFELVVPL